MLDYLVARRVARDVLSGKGSELRYTNVSTDIQHFILEVLGPDTEKARKNLWAIVEKFSDESGRLTYSLTSGKERFVENAILVLYLLGDVRVGRHTPRLVEFSCGIE